MVVIGSVPLQMEAYPGGVGSAKEAVMLQIANENKAQNDLNKIGGGRKSRRIKRRTSSNHTRRRNTRRKIHRRKSSSSSSSSSYKKKNNNKKNKNKKKNLDNILRRLFYGGEGPVEGDKISVPTFPGSSTGPLSANSMSANLNLALATSQQGAKYDEDIGK
jgi:hypothetical protein